MSGVKFRVPGGGDLGSGIMDRVACVGFQGIGVQLRIKKKTMENV